MLKAGAGGWIFSGLTRGGVGRVDAATIRPATTFTVGTEVMEDAVMLLDRSGDTR
jgi:hypothetical protein